MKFKISIVAFSLFVTTVANAFDLGKLKDAVKQVQQVQKDGGNAVPQAPGTLPLAPSANETPDRGGENAPNSAPSRTNPDCLSVSIKKPKQSLDGLSARASSSMAMSDSHWDKSNELCLYSENVKYQTTETIKGVSLGKANLDNIRKEMANYKSCAVELSFLEANLPEMSGVSEHDRNYTMYWDLLCQGAPPAPFETFRIVGTKDSREKGYDTVLTVRAMLVNSSRPDYLDINSEYSKAVIAKFGPNYESKLNNKKQALMLIWSKADGLNMAYVPGWVTTNNSNDTSTILELSNSSYRDLTLKRTAQRYLAPVIEEQKKQKQVEQNFKPSL